MAWTARGGFNERPDPPTQLPCAPIMCEIERHICRSWDHARNCCRDERCAYFEKGTGHD